MIEVSAPGKLYIAGEYAVVEPGHPAIIVAIDQFMTVTIEPAKKIGSIQSAQYSDYRSVGHAAIMNWSWIFVIIHFIIF